MTPSCRTGCGPPVLKIISSRKRLKEIFWTGSKGRPRLILNCPTAQLSGDVDVEERLSFAFDEPQDTSSAPCGTGTGPKRPDQYPVLSPYAPDEVMGQSERMLLAAEVRNSETVPAGACLRIRRRRRITFYTGLYWITRLWPSRTSRLLQPTGLRPWLEGLQPPVLETSPAEDEPSAIGETITPNMPLLDLKPWLIGLQPPVLEAAAPSNYDQPVVQEADASSLPPENIQAIRGRGTRPFSVGAMFHQTDFLSESFIGDKMPPTSRLKKKTHRLQMLRFSGRG